MENKRFLTGFWLTAFSFAFWGLFPIYWKMLSDVPSVELFAYRIVFSCVTAAIFLLVAGQLKQALVLLKDSRTFGSIVLSTLAIGLNWFCYIYAMVTDNVVQASLGYYINPLFSVFLGMVFLKERVNLTQAIAILLAMVGVAVMTVGYGQFPWIALGLCIGFGFYGLIKKTSPIATGHSLFLETLFLTPAALFYLCMLISRETIALFQFSWSGTPLLALTGFLTLLPLFLFSEGAKRIPLSLVGFLQYMAPTGILLLGTLLYHEPFTTAHAVSFAFIWIAVLLFSISRTVEALRGRGSTNEPAVLETGGGSSPDRVD